MDYFQAFIDDLRTTHGSNLTSVILYGSAAAGDFVPRRSDYNILVALKTIAPADLRNAHACIREWVRLGNPVPVYFTVSEIKNAVDVFPIEFHQMTIAHKVLYGPDLVAGIEVSDKSLRLQTEYELRSKLIQLRREYIRASESVDGLKTLMVESLSSFVTLFRAVLILQGLDSPATKHEIVELTVRNLGVDASPFDKIFDIRENKLTHSMDELEVNALFSDYLAQIERVIQLVDGLEK